MSSFSVFTQNNGPAAAGHCAVFCTDANRDVSLCFLVRFLFPFLLFFGYVEFRSVSERNLLIFSGFRFSLEIQICLVYMLSCNNLVFVCSWKFVICSIIWSSRYLYFCIAFRCLTALILSSDFSIPTSGSPSFSFFFFDVIPMHLFKLYRYYTELRINACVHSLRLGMGWELLLGDLFSA